MKPKRLLKATDKFEFPSSGKVYSIWSYGDKHSFDKAEPKGEPQRTHPDLFCPETSRHDCSLSQYLGMKGGRSPNTPSHPSLLSSPRSLSFSTLTLVQGMQYMIFFFPRLLVSSFSQTPASTYLLHENDKGRIVPLLCHQASIGRHHVEAPRGLSRAHLGLGGVLLPQSVCAVVGHNPPIPKEY